MYAQDSIELLTTSGIQFKKHEDEGIETLYFAELLMTSGVVLCDGVKWLSFHRYSAACYALTHVWTLTMSNCAVDVCRTGIILVLLSIFRYMHRNKCPKKMYLFLPSTTNYLSETHYVNSGIIGHYLMSHHTFSDRFWNWILCSVNYFVYCHLLVFNIVIKVKMLFRTWIIMIQIC